MVLLSHGVQNLGIATLLLAANVFQFLLLPALLLPASPWWLLCLLPLAALNNTLWYAIHESFHGGLHPDRRVNELAGRAMTVAFGAPYFVARLGHLMHHRFNRSVLDRPDVYDPARSSWIAAALGYYPRLLGGLYLAELASYLLFVLPAAGLPERIRAILKGDEPSVQEVRKTALAQLTSAEGVAATRLDGVLTLGLLGLSLMLYGPWWPVPLAILAARGLMVSFTDNLPHYGTPLDQPRYAYNLALPTVLARLILNFNHHRTHHQQPTAAWQELPAQLQARGETLETSYMAAALRQLRGPIAMADLKGAGD